MELQFLGGASEVGRSAILFKGSKHIIMDYGIKLNHKTEYPLPAGRVDACVLSHAHIDHSGNFPFLYKDELPITYGTEPTKELSSLLVEDSMKVGKKNHQPPKFNKHNLRSFLERFSSHDFGEEIELGEYSITLYDAGHISGSSITKIESRKSGRKLVYTGDFKLEPQMIQGSADIVKSDILLTETTYANREHPEREELIRKFADEVRQTLDNGGTALIPSFAVGRAQEILAVLHKYKLSDRVFIDGMARKATQIAMRYPEYIRNVDLLHDAIKKIMWIGSEEHRGHAVSGPSIILTTAGMLNGGPVLNYLTKLGPNSKIFLTGYQVEGTNGRKLMEGKPLSIDGRKEVVKTPWVYYDFSAHAGKSDLYEYVKKSSPELVICVHGDQKIAEEFAESLKVEGFKTHVPRQGDSIKLDF
ncbi:MAG: MBL fold metallo-hydrolase [Candidatus Micrarchaeota archaeon]|nr:MBL fold metallo-hydrolase [Candidatus Micrarchaeota archaeon]